MKKLIPILTAILAVQILLAIILFSYQGDTGAFHSEQALLGLNNDAFDSITIEQKDKPALTLKKGKDFWLLPSYFKMPVDIAKVDNFSGKLLTLKTGWPVASTGEAAERFQVNNDKFERKIKFEKDGKPVLTLYLGTSPGFKKIHARVDGQNDIQMIDFAAFEASVTPEDWMKQDLLKIDSERLSQVKAKDFTLVKVGQDWTVEGLQAGQTANTTEVKAFLDKLTGLTCSSILGVEDKPEYKLKEPALSFTIKKQDVEIFYQFGKLDGADDYVLKVSNQPYYFQLNKTQVDSLKEISHHKLIMQKPAEDTIQDVKPTTTK